MLQLTVSITNAFHLCFAGITAWVGNVPVLLGKMARRTENHGLTSPHLVYNRQQFYTTKTLLRRSMHLYPSLGVSINQQTKIKIVTKEFCSHPSPASPPPSPTSTGVTADSLSQVANTCFFQHENASFICLARMILLMMTAADTNMHTLESMIRRTMPILKVKNS